MFYRFPEHFDWFRRVLSIYYKNVKSFFHLIFATPYFCDFFKFDVISWYLLWFPDHFSDFLILFVISWDLSLFVPNFLRVLLMFLVIISLINTLIFATPYMHQQIKQKWSTSWTEIPSFCAFGYIYIVRYTNQLG